MSCCTPLLSCLDCSSVSVTFAFSSALCASNLGAFAIIWRMVSSLKTFFKALASSVGLALLSRLERPESALESKLSALDMAASSTLNIEDMSKEEPFSSCSSSKVFPVKTSTSGFASCCLTMSVPAAMSMSWVESDGR